MATASKTPAANVNDLSQWKKTGLKNYEVWLCKPPIGTEIQNELKGVKEKTDEARPFVLSGLAGEQSVVDLSVLTNFVFATGESITNESLSRKMKNGVLEWTKIKSMGSGMYLFAFHLSIREARFKNFAVQYQGVTLIANRDGLKHGDGDYLICNMSANGMPDIQNVWIENGRTFAGKYNLTNIKVSDKARAAAEKTLEMPKSICTTGNKSFTDHVETFMRKIITTSLSEFTRGKDYLSMTIKAIHTKEYDQKLAETTKNSLTASQYDKLICGVILQDEFVGTGAPVQSVTICKAYIDTVIKFTDGSTTTTHGMVVSRISKYDTGKTTSSNNISLHYISTYSTLHDDVIVHGSGQWVYLKLDDSAASRISAVTLATVKLNDSNVHLFKNEHLTIKADKTGINNPIRVHIGPANNTKGTLTTYQELVENCRKKRSIMKAINTGLRLSVKTQDNKIVQSDIAFIIEDKNKSYLFSAFSEHVNQYDIYTYTSLSPQVYTTRSTEQNTDGTIFVDKKSVVGNIYLYDILFDVAYKHFSKMQTDGEKLKLTEEMLYDSSQTFAKYSITNIREVCFTDLDGEHDPDSLNFARNANYRDNYISKCISDIVRYLIGYNEAGRISGLIPEMKEYKKLNPTNLNLRHLPFVVFTALCCRYYSSILKTLNKHGVKIAKHQYRDDWFDINLTSYTNYMYRLSWTGSNTYYFGKITENAKMKELKSLVSDKEMLETFNMITAIDVAKYNSSDITSVTKLCDKCLDTPLGRVLWAEFKKFMQSVMHDDSRFISKFHGTSDTYMKKLAPILSQSTGLDTKLNFSNKDEMFIELRNHDLDKVAKLIIPDGAEALLLKAGDLDKKYLLDTEEKADVAPYRALIDLCKQRNINPVHTRLTNKYFWNSLTALMVPYMSYTSNVNRITVKDLKVSDNKLEVLVTICVEYKSDNEAIPAPTSDYAIRCITNIKAMKDIAGGTQAELGAKHYYECITAHLEEDVAQLLSFAYKIDGTRLNQTINASLNWNLAYLEDLSFAEDLANAIGSLIDRHS